MEALSQNVEEKTEREITRLMGNRLLGWAIISLWATAVFVLFRVFRDLPQIIDTWLLWIAPLMILRGVVGVMLHKQLTAAYMLPSIFEMRRMSYLSAVSDGLLILSAAFVFSAGGAWDLSPLMAVVTVACACLAMVYMFTPLAWLVATLVAVVPSLVAALMAGFKIPLDLLIVSGFVLLGTYFGVSRFKGFFISQLSDNIAYQDQIHEASESNFIFNQHWQKMHFAAVDWDRDFHIRSWNPAAERLFGYSADEVVGKPLEFLVGSDQGAEVKNSWRDQPDDCALSLRRCHHKSGASVVTEWYDTPLMFEGEMIGVASYVLDPGTRGAIRELEGAQPCNVAAVGQSQSAQVKMYSAR